MLNVKRRMSNVKCAEHSYIPAFLHSFIRPSSIVHRPSTGGIARTAAAVLFVLAMFCGCQTPSRLVERPTGCAGKATIQEAAEILNAQQQQIAPLQATAACVLSWRDDKGKMRREQFDAQVRFVPPDDIFFRGDKFGEIRLGTNADEFWLRIKAELDTYWYGRREQANACASDLPLNPSNLTEAMGQIVVDASWEMFHRDGWDILTLRQGGRPVKQAYVNACTYRVERIEYYNADGFVTAATELSNYAASDDGLTLPTTLRLITLRSGLEDSSAQFELRNIRRFEPTAVQREKMFARPPRDGYKTVLRLDANCNFIEEN